MSVVNDGGQAFPVPVAHDPMRGIDRDVGHYLIGSGLGGMTLRQRYALAIAQGQHAHGGAYAKACMPEAAAYCFEFADAMIAHEAKEREGGAK